MFDFDSAVSAPFRMQPGLRRLEPGALQLTGLTPTQPAFSEKLAVLRDHAAESLLQVQGFDGGPALDAVIDLAQQQCPQALRRDGALVLAPALGIAIDAEARLHAVGSTHADALAVLTALPSAWRRAGLLCLALHEDLAVLDGAGATLPWLAVCLPSHWRPRDKVGRSFAEAHGPVADNALIVNAARHLSALACREPRWERFVWTLGPSPGHDQHPERQPARRWPEASAFGHALHFRTERQTFIPLPGQAQAVFTIHVDVQPIDVAVNSPQRALALHDAIASMSDAVLDYRALREVRAPLLAWLAQRAATAGA